MYFQPQPYGTTQPYWMNTPAYGSATAPRMTMGPGLQNTAQPPRMAAPNEKASLLGNGRIQEADGGQYQFQGSGTYRLLKDKDIDLRGALEQSEKLDGLVLTEAGLTVGDQILSVRADGMAYLSGGTNAYKPIADGQSQSLGNGALLNRQGNSLKVKTSEYTVVFDLAQPVTLEGQQAMNIRVETGGNGVNQDGTMPTGLLGETFDADKRPQAYTRNQWRDGGYTQADLPGKVYKWDPDSGKIGYGEMLCSNVLGRKPANQQEMFLLSDKVTDGGSRSAILHVLNSEEFKAKNYSGEQKAEILYKTVLNRKADAAAIAEMAGRLNGGQSMDEAVDSLLFSQEYFDLYKSGKMPCAMSNKEAVQLLQGRYRDLWQLNDRSGLWYFDQYIHRKNLEKAAGSGDYDNRAKTALQCVLGNETLFRNLDAAGGGNGPDDKIGGGDFEALLKDAKINSY